MHPSDDLPEDHDALLRLAADVSSSVTARHARASMPSQRPAAPRAALSIPAEADALVDGPLVGFATHGR